MKNKMLMQFLNIGLFIFTITPLMAQITEIIAIDSVKYKIGDKIKMGKAMNDLPEYSFAIQYPKENMGNFKKSTIQANDSLIIIGITETTSLGDYNVKCQSPRDKAEDFYYSYFFTFNKSIVSGEVVSKNSNYFVAPTSEKALEQIKKAKEKLDLGLITKDEYEKKINELKKYIKD